MINKIAIRNYKALESFCFELGNLNILTGKNSSGKSSLIQALLLLRQSYLNGYFFKPRKKPMLFLGDTNSLIRQGTFQDVLNDQATARAILKIALTEKNETYTFESLADNNNTRHKDSSSIEGHINLELNKWDGLSIFSDRFQYLAADRIAPQESYPNPNNGHFLGKKGEYAPHFLEQYGNKPIPIKSLMHDQTVRKNQDTLSWQINYWLRDISPGIEVQVQPNPTTNRTELLYRYNHNGIPEGDRKPQNVGYGITPTLPILMAILAAKPGDLIILENPETHIHPYGQASLAHLMVRAAQAGVQIIVETHSDHIVNGSLVESKKIETEKEEIFHDKIKMYYFDKNQEHRTIIQDIPILEKSKIKSPPNGFFDQISKDIRYLIRP